MGLNSDEEIVWYQVLLIIAVDIVGFSSRLPALSCRDYAGLENLEKGELNEVGYKLENLEIQKPSLINEFCRNIYCDDNMIRNIRKGEEQ